MVEQYDQKGIQFVAQSNRDFIVQAARHLHKSEWQNAMQSITQIKFFSNLAEFTEGSLKNALTEALKQISLKIYMIESQNQYESYSISNFES